MNATDLPSAPLAQLAWLGDAPLTVACVFRSGGRYYSPRHVEILRNMVARNLSLPHRFVCLTDVAAVPCERIPLVTDWPGFYAKLELFRPGLFRGPVLYFDLDTVIHRNIDELARLAQRVAFGCVSDPAGGHMNSSVQSFTVDCSFIFERFRRARVARRGFLDLHAHTKVYFALRHLGLSHLVQVGSSYGDQGFSEMCLAEHHVPVVHLDRVLPDALSVYTALADREAEPASSVCLMMGRPKPHQVTHGWVAQHWH